MDEAQVAALAGREDLQGRKLLLMAAESYLSQLQLGLDHRNMPAILSALRLGFAIGTDERPERFVPPVAVEAATREIEEAGKLQAERGAAAERSFAPPLNYYALGLSGKLW